MKVSPFLVCLLVIPVFFSGCIDQDVEGQADVYVIDLYYPDFAGDDYTLTVQIRIRNDFDREMTVKKSDIKLLTMDDMVINATIINGEEKIEIDSLQIYSVTWKGISKEHMGDSIYVVSHFKGGIEKRSEEVQLDFSRIFLRDQLFNVKGTYNEKREFTRPESVIMGNFDNDRSLEIAVGAFGGSPRDYPRLDPGYSGWVNDGLFIGEQGPSEHNDPLNSTRLGNGTCCKDVAVGDINMDGLDDLAACYWNSDTVEVFLQRTPGIFKREPDMVLLTSNQPHNLTIQDIDLDPVHRTR